MNFTFRPAARSLISCFCLTALLNASGGSTPILHAQEPAKPQSDDVLRINTDPDRIPFGEELALKTLAPGRYDLKVTITDSLAGTSITQTVIFEVL